MQHPHGTFCFAELQTSDVDRDARFYTNLFGWTIAAVPGVEGYSVFRLEGKEVAAIRRTNGHRRWIPYVSVGSADETATRAHTAGAAVVTVPYDEPGFGRFAVLHDPAGGVIGLWEAGERSGAQVLDEPGALWWVELLTRDVLVAKNFYAGLLGWHAVDTLKYGIRYSVFKIGEHSVGGLLPIGSDWGAVTPYWQLLFAVHDCDAQIARATALGGAVVFGPNDVPNAGRAAIIRDPGSALFVLMQPES